MIDIIKKLKEIDDMLIPNDLLTCDAKEKLCILIDNLEIQNGMFKLASDNPDVTKDIMQEMLKTKVKHIFPICTCKHFCGNKIHIENNLIKADICSITFNMHCPYKSSHTIPYNMELNKK